MNKYLVLNDRQKNIVLWSLIAITLCWILYSSLSNMSYSIWGDEGDTIRVSAQSGIKQVIYSAIKYRPYPPLYFMIVNQFLKWRNDEMGLRLPSMIFGILAVFSVFLLGKTCFNRKTGVLAALLFLLTPGLFRYFVDGNCYIMLAGFTALSAYSLFKALESDKTFHWVIYAIFSIINLGIHSFAIFHIFSQVIVTILFFIFEKDLTIKKVIFNFKRVWPKMMKALMSTLSIILVWLLWIIFYLSNSGVTQSLDISKIFSINTIFLFGVSVFGFFLKAPPQLALVCFLLITGAIYMLFENKRKLICLLALLVIPVVSITLFVKATIEFAAYKYVIGSFPFTCVLMASNVQLSKYLYKQRKYKFVSVASMMTFLMLGVYLFSGFFAINFPKHDLFEYQDWKGAAAYLFSHVNKNDVIVVYPEDTLIPLSYYDKSSIRKYLIKDLNELANIVAKHLNETTGKGKKVWIVEGFFEGSTNPLKKYWHHKVGTPLDVEKKASAKITNMLKQNFKDISVDKQFFQRVLVLSVSQP